MFDLPEDVPADVKENKRYEAAGSYTVSETAEKVAKDFGKIDILVHSLANGPEVRGCTDARPNTLAGRPSPSATVAMTVVVTGAPTCPCATSTILVPQVKKPLLETSRQGYLAALSASSYSFISMLQRFGPLMNEGGAAVSLTYLASERVIPGYGGGMSSAKAALESDTRVLAYEAGRKASGGGRHVAA